MTRKLEEFFNMPPIDNTAPETEKIIDTINEQKAELASAENIIDRINNALPMVNELDQSDNEMDELATLARTKFEDLMDLGMNVEARFSGPILQTAGVLLGHAITAKQSKIDRKLRTIDLQLKKMRLDQTDAKSSESSLLPLNGHAVVLDRNELLRQIIADSKSAKKLN